MAFEMMNGTRDPTVTRVVFVLLIGAGIALFRVHYVDKEGSQEAVQRETSTAGKVSDSALMIRLEHLEASGAITNGNVYVNDVVGISVKIPSGWLPTSAEKLKAVEDARIRAGGNQAPDARLISIESMKQHDLSISCFDASSVKGYSEREYAVAMVKQYADVMKAQIAVLKDGAVSDVRTHLIENRLGGKAIFSGTFELVGEEKLKGRIFMHFARHRNFVIEIIGNCPITSDCDEIDKVLDGITFS